MNKSQEAGYIFRIAVVALITPVLLVATGFFILNEMYLYAAAMIIFAGLMGYGVYMNWKRLISDQEIDDERMQKINWKSGFNAFWVMVDFIAISWAFKWFITDITPLTSEWIMRSDTTIVIALGFISFFLSRSFYLYYGLESGFRRWKS